VSELRRTLKKPS